MRLSISRIKAFKSCRRLYELRYLEHMMPVQKSEALEIGSNYHKLLEELYTQGHHWDYVDHSKERAMAEAYYHYIYPKFNVIEAEKWIEYDLGDGDKLVGCVDAVAADGCIVEHKTFGGNESFEQYEYGLQWDEQLLAYMMITGARKVYYTVCRKPSIRLRKDETEEAFFGRMVEWYNEDTENKIRLFEITRTDEEVEAFRDDLMMIYNEMKHAGYFYKNTCNCNIWGRRCEYSSICQHFDPNEQYIEFVKEEDDYEPTKNFN